MVIMANIQQNTPANTLHPPLEFAYIPNSSIEVILAAIQTTLFCLKKNDPEHSEHLSQFPPHTQHNLGWLNLH